MKTFLSIIPFQYHGNFHAYKYVAADNQRLAYNHETHFPILAAINGYCEKGDEVRVIVIGEDNENSRINAKTFETEFNYLCSMNELSCPNGIETIIVPTEDDVSRQISTFQTLIDMICDDDELFVCMTYGTKPKSSTMLLATQYAYRIKNNVSISCVVYGQVDRSQSGGDHTKDRASIFDMTSLIMLDEMIRVMADEKVQNPRKLLETILSL